MQSPVRGALVAALLVASLGCGADGIDAPATAPDPACRQVDDYLAPIVALMEQGKLANLRRAIAQGLPEDARRDLVATVLRLAAGFDEGTFTALAEVFPAAPEGEETVGLQATLGRLLRWLGEDGPGAPYPSVLAATRAALNTCEGGPPLALLAGVLRDDALLRAAADAATGGGVATALEALSVDGVTGREALRLLLRNLMVAAAGPDFEIAALTDLLGAVVDLDEAPWPALIDGLERHLGTPPGRAALRGLLTCVLAVDPDVSLGGLLWDLWVEAPVGLDEVVEALAPPGQPVLPPAAGDALAGTLERLAGDAEARRALAAVATELLREDVAPGVLGDVADLLEAGAIGDVVALLAALATGPCR